MISNNKLYPFLFTPIYKEVIWGGDQLNSCFKRELPKTKLPIGESWEISDRENDLSIVENGELKGRNIKELIDTFGADIIGERYLNKKFPLLIKFIDAGDKLSIQVHPDENTCKIIPGAEPKTEMWYVISAINNAKIYAGLTQNATKEIFLETCKTPEIEKLLKVYLSEPGDSYFISSGTVHAIGGGNLLLEIQQNSDTTYRISDWGRLTPEGKPRQLHIEEALKSIHFNENKNYRKPAVISEDSILANSPFFKVERLLINSERIDNTITEKEKNFHIITTVDDSVIIINNDSQTIIPYGRTCLIPASFGKYVIKTEALKKTYYIKITA